MNLKTKNLRLWKYWYKWVLRIYWVWDNCKNGEKNENPEWLCCQTTWQIFLTSSSKEIRAWEFPGGTVIRNRYFHCQVRFGPWWGNQDPGKSHCTAKRKKSDLQITFPRVWLMLDQHAHAQGRALAFWQRLTTDMCNGCLQNILDSLFYPVSPSKLAQW